MATNFGTFSASAVLTAAQMNSFGGAWDSYTPTWTGITLGSATNLGRVQQIGRTTVFVAQLTLSGSTMTGPVTVSLPYTAARTYGGVFAFTPRDASFGDFLGMARQASTTAVTLTCVNIVTGSYAYEIALTSAIPHAWANTDSLLVAGIYEAAADPT